MTDTASQLSLATAPGLVCFRVRGKPTLDLSGNLRSAGERLIRVGHTHVLVDLAECPAVDSTFAGVLIFLSKAAARATPPGRVGLLEVGDLVRHQLDSLGILPLFDLARRHPGGVEFTELALKSGTKAENTWLCLTAHRELVEANEANAARFRDVIELLEGELSRQPPPPPPPG